MTPDRIARGLVRILEMSFNPEISEVVNGALKIVWKEIPEMPKHDNEYEWLCAKCGGIVGYDEIDPSGITPIRFEYCPTCGKKVLWDD